MDSTAILNLLSWWTQTPPALAAGAQRLAEAAASTVIAGMWQGAVVACGLAVCLKLAPVMPARMRYGMWAAGFAALVCLPFLPAVIERLKPANGVAFGRVAAFTAGSASHSLLAVDARWSFALACVWLAASLLRAASLAAHGVRMRNLWRSASPVRDTVGGGVARGLVGSSLDGRGRAEVELCATSDLDKPCVIGFFRPRILIPAWLLSRLTPAELEQVVLHEQEHLRRGDDWANLLQKICLVVFPLNPALWWLERRLCAEREMACDDGVVGRTQAPRAYAACLAGLAEKGLKHREAALSLGAWRRRPELAERVHRLLRRGPALNPAASAASVVLVGCGLVAGTVALARCPQLVAFVAPPTQEPTALSASAHAGQLMEGDTRTDFIQGAGALAGTGAGPYHAVKTMAMVPAMRRSASLPSLHVNGIAAKGGVAADEVQGSDDARQAGRSLASLVPAAVAARMRAQQVSTLQAPEASARLNGSAEKKTAQAATSEIQAGWIVLTTFEDVEATVPGSQVQGDSVLDDTGAQPSTSMSVTHLVLRLEQPAANAQPAAKADPSSNSTQPLVIPYRDGWFVIQL